MAISTNVSLGNLSDAINKAIQEKGEKIKTESSQALSKAKDLALQEINQNAPRSNRNVTIHLADSFIADKKMIGEKEIYKIYSKEKGPLVHLVEFGFVHYKSKKYVKGKQFVLPAYDKAVEQLIKDIKNIIDN